MLQKSAYQPGYHKSTNTYFQNDKLHLGDIIGMNPVFSCLSNETGLATSC